MEISHTHLNVRDMNTADSKKRDRDPSSRKFLALLLVLCALLLALTNWMMTELAQANPASESIAAGSTMALEYSTERYSQAP